MRESSFIFQFRVWLPPQDGGPPDIETWYPNIENMRCRMRPYSSWAAEALECEDLHAAFDAVGSDCWWQVMGTAKLMWYGDSYDLDNYTEACDIISYTKERVPDDYAEAVCESS